jgi:16S rRNA (cytidine1402-2'-O)-methyltransferase
MPGGFQWRSVGSVGERASFEWYNNRSLHAMSGTLYVVATPIGNLEDITLRALRVLREVDLIAAEDTRRTARLLAHYSISTPTTSFHEHNTRTRSPRLIRKLQEGGSVAVVTDAGTPGVSDPGMELVAACVALGIPVDPIPGVSAPLVAAVAAGFPLDLFTIRGFVPSRAKDRNGFVSTVSETDGVVAFFEAPHRVRETLSDLATVLGERQIVVGRELTKLHQEFLRGTAAAILERLSDPRGEFTIVVGPRGNAPVAAETPDDTTLAAEFGRLAESQGLGRRAALATVARKYGRPTREIYAAIERAKSLVDTQKDNG